MTESRPSPADRPIRDAVLRQEELCDQFSVLWIAGFGKPVKEFLNDLGATDLPAAVIEELIQIEHDHRRVQGEEIAANKLTERTIRPAMVGDTSQVSPCDETSTVTYIGSSESSVRTPAASDAAFAGEASPTLDSTIEVVASGPVPFGRFTLQKLIGQGAFGEVWQAYDPNLDRIIALKRLKSGEYSADARERFLREGRAAAQLRHPNIVGVHDVGLIDGRPYIVYEFIEGRTLQDYLQTLRAAGRALSIRTDVKLIGKLALALYEAHQRGIVHRDLKPANILFDPKRREPLLTDFGMARREAEFELTQAGAILGTPAYMSPEQWDSQPADSRSDVYSLGVILFELLTGERPFRSERDWRLMKQQVLCDDPPRLTTLNGQVSVELETICLRCLEKEPARRFASAKHLADELGRFLRGEPIHSRAIKPWERTWKWYRRNLVVGTLSVAVAVTLVVGIVVSTWFGIRENLAAKAAKWQEEVAKDQEQKALALEKTARSAEARANHEAQRATKLADEERQAREETEAILASSNFFLAHSRWNEGRVAEAQNILQSIPKKYRDWEWRYSRRLFEGSDATLYGNCDGRCVIFSPDGQRIASSNNNTISFLDAQSGAELFKLECNGAVADALAFRSDGNQLASSNDRGKITIWDLRTRKEVLTFGGHEDGLSGPLAFSLDGRYLTSASGTFSEGPSGESIPVSEMIRWDVWTGESLRKFNLGECLASDGTFSWDGRQLACRSISTGGVMGDRDVIHLWDTQTGEEFSFDHGESFASPFVSFSPDGLRLASYSHRRLNTWDVRTGRKLLTLEDNGRRASFSPDGQRLVSVTDDGQIRLYDARTGTNLFTIQSPPLWITTVSFSPDGQRLVSAARDGTIKLWDTRTGTQSVTLQKNTSELALVSFSPDNKLLSSLDSNTIKIWNLRTGAERLTLRDDDGNSFHCMVFSPDAKQLAAATYETINIWGDCLPHRSE